MPQQSNEPATMQDKLTLLQEEPMKLPDLNIAVAGMAGRFPKSDSVSEFELNLLNGVDMINDNDDARYACGLWGLPPRSGRLKDLTRFDSEFFGFSQDEANYIDFQLRILYEVVYESILDAGINPASLRASNTGVFFGLHCNEFENAMADDPNFKSNGYYAQFAVKVAQYFDLRGLNVTFDAACASGFVGFHNAVEAIEQGLIEQAIVCSSNIPIHPTGSFIFLQMQMLSPTGYSRFLDSRADGYVKSEACVSIFLQKKDLARRNYASVMASMTSVDGYKAEGITFPSFKSQQALIESTKQQANLSTNHIEYLEAHGTGTPAGDPQEVRAISNVYCPSKPEAGHDQAGAVTEERKIGPLLVGSVKTNMGHSEAASGLCAMVKVAMMLENELIYPSLHYEQPNANIEALMDGRIVFVDDTRKLNAKVVPLSCYGFGGSNVHAILRSNELPKIDDSNRWQDKSTNIRLVLMFGRSEQSVNGFFDKMMDRNSRATQNCLSDDFIALVNSLSRDEIDRMMKYRGYMLVDLESKREVARKVVECNLKSVDRRDVEADIGRKIHIQEHKKRAVSLLLPGLGCQWFGMAHGLQRFEPFWSTIKRLNGIIQEHSKKTIDLESLLGESSEQTQQDFNQLPMQIVFILIVSYQIALINLLRRVMSKSFDCVESIIGHSLGEICCAYSAGLLDEKEALLTAFEMGRVLDENASTLAGKMTVVFAGEVETQKLLDDCKSAVQISCVNGPESVTISGPADQVDDFCKLLDGRNISSKDLRCSFQIHNRLVMNKSIENKLKSAISKVVQKHPTGSPIEATKWTSTFDFESEFEFASAGYFAANLCRKVDFYRSASRSLPEDCVVIEVGPQALFQSQVVDLTKGKVRYVSLMKGSTHAEYQMSCLLHGLGDLYQAGVSLDVAALHEQPIQVRRQTPSVSSLIEWNHESEFFVPRYPQQFSKSSAKSEMPVDLVQERDKYLAGHCVEGRVLFPATGYLFLIWRVFSFTQRKIYDACFHDVEKELVPVEFHNIQLKRAVILGSRATQIYTHLEEGTGRFEIREGGSVVVEGYVKSPEEKPQGLLYEHVKERIRDENLQTVLNEDDIYKQFRVSGYDYGDTFRNVVDASSDGRYCRVKFNGHFVALTDSILQSIFLAITQYAPSGGLFLPTRFEYVRFQPQIILDKIHKAGMQFDLIDGSLNTKEKRKIMTKIMQRETGFVDANEKPTQDETQSEQSAESRGESPIENKPECIFETYCDPITGIIITDGIEMRGIKASPAPRKSENTSDILLESYQFVKDIEEPIVDEPLTRFEAKYEPYTRVCDSMSLKLLNKLFGIESIRGWKRYLSDQEIESYLDAHLAKRYKMKPPVRCMDEDTDDQEPAYDINENGNLMLMSIFDQLLVSVDRPKHIKNIVQNNRLHLMKDFLLEPLIGERIMRPIMESVIENCCTKKMRLRMMEINLDDGILYEPLNHLLQSVEPTLVVDYSLAHPDLTRLSLHKLTPNQQQVKSHTLKDLSSLFSDAQVRDLDLIVYKDISCYSLPKQVVEQNGLAPVLASLKSGLKSGGFAVVIMRRSLTLAERILLALSEPEMVGLSKQTLQEIQSQATDDKLTATARKIEQINAILEARYGQMLREAERNEMTCLARKCDSNGCSVLLFKKPADKPQNKGGKQILPIRLRHDDKVETWLEQLKLQFEKPKEEEVEKTKSKNTQSSIVWLCAVATKDNPISGVVGMMQALRKELGSSRLRCFYDQQTFKDMNEPISVEMIQQSPNFQLALARDSIWNCVDSQGNFGAYRHFTITDYTSLDECRCSEIDRATDKRQVRGAFVNCATRGDLSSFAWFEAPLKHLTQEQSDSLVRVSYSALNFRDIMIASGRLPLDALPISLALSDCLLGLEFSGYDVTGKRVMGMVPGRGIASHVVCPKDCSVKIEVPQDMTLQEAATMPIVYSTAVMALIYRGHMKRGETILIHAGSGGVGQAAIRLAAHWGLEIFTTVGTDDKRNFLIEEFPEAVKADHIFSSRDCKFEEQIMRMTNGRGVDLVLNSLADEKLQASVRCLADGGRFLEIGKYDMSINAKIELLKLDTNKTFHGILLDKIFDSEDFGVSFKQQMRCILDTFKDGLKQGYIRPIKYKTFKKNQVEEAFRFMATGKHIGKVLIEIEPEPDTLQPVPSPHQDTLIRCAPRLQLSPTKSYIVTGGLGGFGMELIKWLASVGARNIVITSRSGIRTGYQQATLQRLESNHQVRFKIVKSCEADASQDSTSAGRLLEMALDFSPERQIGGLFHLAMVLKDTMLENMTAEDFEIVCRPKVATFDYLHQASRDLDIEYFVAFSSITCGKGNAGQANYAYANSCLERICEVRRSEGKHGLAIQWGAIGDVGVAYENLGGNDVIIGGTRPQRMPSCLATLAKLLGTPFTTCLSVLPVNRNAEGAGVSGDLVGAVLHVLGIKDHSKVSDEATLGELGLDSLMAVEIRQYIEREYDLTMNMQEIRSLTIAKIRHISETGKPNKAALSSGRGSPADGETKQVENYGTQAASSKSQSTSGAGSPEPVSSSSDSDRSPSESEVGGEKSHSAADGFVSELERPVMAVI